MPRELKIIFITLFLLSFIGFGWVVFTTSQSDFALGEIKNLENIPAFINLGDIPRLGGIVSGEFSIKNTSVQTLKLRKITTSCMCTKAKIVIDGKETKYFSLEHNGDKNAPVNLGIRPGQEAKVVFQFDPNAHGPKGVGFFDRSIQLIFSDPPVIKELKFSGKVI